MCLILHLLHVRSFSKQLKNQSPFKQKCERITNSVGHPFGLSKGWFIKNCGLPSQPKGPRIHIPHEQWPFFSIFGHGNGSGTLFFPKKKWDCPILTLTSIVGPGRYLIFFYQSHSNTKSCPHACTLKKSLHGSYHPVCDIHS